MPGSVIPVVIGVDIGGTNTDAVLVSRQSGVTQVLAEVKELTTRDVTSGVQKAILRCLILARDRRQVVAPVQVNIGTTHFVNAVVQGKHLARVAVVRICGPVSEELPPFCDFPAELTSLLRDSVHLVRGGYRYDGQEHEPLDEQQLVHVLEHIRHRGITNIAYVGIFSPTRNDQELRARTITAEVYPEATVSLSHEIGHIGLLERENATILNECLKPLCRKTISGFRLALDEIGVDCPLFLTQNDGTVISSDDVLRWPVFTFASGPTNSMRGASFLSELQEAVVLDIGGTTTDAGVIKNGFPREASTHVKVGGVRTNFRMPDVVSIGLGGGSYVQSRVKPDGAMNKVTVGPLSAGLNLKREAYVFSDGSNLDRRRLTATDVAVAAGLCDLGCPEVVKNVDKDIVDKAVDEIHTMLEELIDRIKLSKEELPVIIVGGGSVLVDLTRKLRGATRVILPAHFGVANAIGAALSKVSSTANTIIDLMRKVDTDAMETSVQEAVNAVTDDPDGKKRDCASTEARKPFLLKARDEAIEEVCAKVKDAVIKQGADPNSLEILDKQDSTIAYIPGNALQVKVKIVGELKTPASGSDEAGWAMEAEFPHILERDSDDMKKQEFSSTGQRIQDGAEIEGGGIRWQPQEPTIDTQTGEWILSEWDIECIVVGAGIYGTGGGGNPQMGRLRALKALRDGKRMRVVNPDKFLSGVDPERSIVAVSAFIGAPLIMYEQGVSSKETTVALECLRDIYEIGAFADGTILHSNRVEISQTEAGCVFIKNYQPATRNESTEYKVVALMSAEIGGLNAIEPFLIAANLDLPILDADGMSRAFPEVQMFLPYMFGCAPYPAAIVGSGNCGTRTVLLKSPTGKLLENFLRDVAIENGCSAGLALPLRKDEVLQKTALHTVSSAWRLGDAILRARLHKDSVVEAIVRQENAKHVMNGKVRDVQRETSGGFNKGHVIIEGVDDWSGQEVHIDFQNENLVLLPIKAGQQLSCLASVPDLICLVDPDTAQPVTTEEVRYGMRLAVLLLPSHQLLRQQEALRWVGPQAFHYSQIEFKPFSSRAAAMPVPPF